MKRSDIAGVIMPIASLLLPSYPRESYSSLPMQYTENSSSASIQRIFGADFVQDSSIAQKKA